MQISHMELCAFIYFSFNRKHAILIFHSENSPLLIIVIVIANGFDVMQGIGIGIRPQPIHQYDLPMKASPDHAALFARHILLIVIRIFVFVLLN